MKYSVSVNGTEIELSLDGDEVRLGAGAAHARLVDPGTGVNERMLIIGSDVHRVQLRPGANRGQYVLWIDGARFDVDALDERMRAIRSLAAATAKPTGPAPLIAPMPGMIVRVNVGQGDAVEPGQGLVVMEAMKMENELRATSRGTVKRVLVSAGTAVEKGVVLLELE
ncbi:MAG TPA: biotin/lipoyl-containing protein [Gemmatimonadaceae bacterium]|jgi:pyruvate carboxylase subunit B